MEGCAWKADDDKGGDREIEAVEIGGVWMISAVEVGEDRNLESDAGHQVGSAMAEEGKRGVTTIKSFEAEGEEANEWGFSL